MLILHKCGAKGPDRSEPQVPVTKLSRAWPIGIAIFAVAQWRNLFSFNLLLTKLTSVAVANCSS